MNDHQHESIIDRHEPPAARAHSDNHMLRLERAGRFRPRLRLRRHRIDWLLSELLDWIERRKDPQPKRDNPAEIQSAPQRYARRQH